MSNPDKKDSVPVLEDPRYLEASKLTNEESEILRLLNERLTRFLTNGQLIGLGYALPRTPDAKAVQIPPDVWAGWIHWEKDKVEGNGLKFIAVRIVRPVAPTQSKKVERPTETAKGRPSRQQQIEAAFWALDEEGSIPDRPENIKALFNLILDKLDELYPDQAGDRRGLSDKTLYKRVSELVETKQLKSKG